jgi:hypothetical protein
MTRDAGGALRKLAWRAHGPRGGVAADLLLKLCQIYELISLPAQLIGHHRRLGLERRYDAYPPPFQLQRSDKGSEISVTCEKHNVIEMIDETHGIDS